MSTGITYGVAVAVLKNKEIYMSRRSEQMSLPKKWQLVYGKFKTGEQSSETARRLLNEQMSINIDRDDDRFFFAKTIHIKETSECYFIYLINLTEDEIPSDTCSHRRGAWRAFKLSAAVVLDVVPGTRIVIKKLLNTLTKIEQTEKSFVNQLTPGESQHLEKLGPKMTRIL